MKRCLQCMCCATRGCLICRVPTTDVPEYLRVTEMARTHSLIHMEFAQEAAAAGNVALAHNEAGQAAHGARVAEEYAQRVDEVAAKACCFGERCDRRRCPAKELAEEARRARENAVAARVNADLAKITANIEGSDPGISGTPNAPTLRGYPGGPPDPFPTRTF